MRIYFVLHIHRSKPYSQITELFCCKPLALWLHFTTFKLRNAYQSDFFKISPFPEPVYECLKYVTDTYSSERESKIM